MSLWCTILSNSGVTCPSWADAALVIFHRGSTLPYQGTLSSVVLGVLYVGRPVVYVLPWPSIVFPERMDLRAGELLSTHPARLAVGGRVKLAPADRCGADQL